jgi:very-short-patch-repair endonuclease
MFILASFLIIFYKVKTSKWPYLKNDSLLTEAEKKFYFILSEIIGNDYLIFSKVRMADLLHLPKMNNSQYYHYHNKIQSKHVDFLICDKENIKPLLVLELDDSSHLKIDRILRDTLVDKIFENAQVPILHVKNSATYDKASLLKQIKMTLI